MNKYNNIAQNISSEYCDEKLLVIARYLNCCGFEFRESKDFIELRIPKQKPVGTIKKMSTGILLEFKYPLMKVIMSAYEKRFQEITSYKNIVCKLCHMAYLVGYMPSEMSIGEYQISLKNNPYQ